MDGRDDDLLIIFSKAPVSGYVKTRLFPHLSFDEAAELQDAFLRDVVETALTGPGREVCLAYTPPGSLGIFMEMFGGRGMKFHPQEGGGLGERMHNAFVCGFGEGAKRAVIVGSDVPTLTPAHIDEAFGSLDTHDISICPTHDGGYCMIGLRRPVPELFEGLQWSTHGVFEATLGLALKLGLKAHILPPISDVDTFEDLAGIADTELPANTEIVVDRLRPRLGSGEGWLL